MGKPAAAGDRTPSLMIRGVVTQVLRPDESQAALRPKTEPGEQLAWPADMTEPRDISSRNPRRPADRAPAHACPGRQPLW